MAEALGLLSSLDGDARSRAARVVKNTVLLCRRLGAIGLCSGLLSGSFAVVVPRPVTAALLYSDDFDSAPVLAPGVSASYSGGGLGAANPFGGWRGNYYSSDRNVLLAPTVLSLTNLPSHSAIDIDFLLGFLESWDSTDGSPAPDYLKVEIDGSPVLLGLTVNNASGTIVNFGGGTATHSTVQANTNYFFSDTLVDMSADPALSFAHSASSLTLAITAYGNGWQGFSDEGWGFDNIAIRYTPADPTDTVPGPLPAVGLAAAFGFSRRLRHRAARSR